MKQELNVQEGSQPVAVASTINPLVEAALSTDIEPEKLKQLLEVQEKWEAGEARKAYNLAMAEFRKDAPVIIKDKKVAFKQTEYSHSSLGFIMATINPLLSEHGFSVSWRTDQEGNLISVTCVVTHSAGHSEETKLSSAADNSGAKNSIQAIGSAVSYLRRYTIEALLGLSTADDDDDGYAAGPEIELITDKQADTIRAMIKSTGSSLSKLLAWQQAETVGDIREGQYKHVIAALHKKEHVANSINSLAKDVE